MNIDTAVEIARAADVEAFHGGEPEPMKVGTEHLWDTGYEFLIPVNAIQEKAFEHCLKEAIECAQIAREAAKRDPDAVQNSTAYLGGAFLRLGRIVAEIAEERGLSVDDHKNLICEEC